MRHAIYYAPAPASLFHKLGSTWLGRDAFSGEAIAQPPVEGIREATMVPARYGLHATLKAPSTLNPDMRRIDFGDAVALVAAQMDVVTIARLELREVDGFLALVPERQQPDLTQLAEFCVRALDSFRLPASEDELRARRAENLTLHQDELMLRWGYPYVLDEFRFHITLTRKLHGEERQHFMAAARQHFMPVIGHELAVDALTIFADSRFSPSFVVEERFPLREATKLRAAS
jgi:hypothetical protein